MIENSVTRVTVRHHKACRVMPNSYPEWRNFQFAPNNHYGFFFLHILPSAIAFGLEYVLFYQIYAEITTFSIKRCSVWFLSKTLTLKHLAENWRHHDVNESPYTPRGKTTFPSGFTEIPVGYARTYNLYLWSHQGFDSQQAECHEL